MERKMTTAQTQTAGTHVQEPSVAYQAYSLGRSSIGYRKEITKAIRRLAEYSADELKAKGIVTKEGKMDAMGLWTYVNEHVGAQLRKKHFANEQEYRLVVPYNVVNSLVRKYKDIDSLMELVANAYGNQGRQFAATRVGEALAAKPLYASKPALTSIASVTSDLDANRHVIDGLTDPQEAAGLGGQLLESLFPKLEEAAGTGTLDTLEQKILKADSEGRLHPGNQTVN